MVSVFQSVISPLQIAQRAVVPVSFKEYPHLSEELNTFSDNYLGYLEEKRNEHGVPEKIERFKAEYSKIRSYIDRLKDVWTTVEKKLEEILSLLRGDIEVLSFLRL